MRSEVITICNKIAANDKWQPILNALKLDLSKTDPNALFRELNKKLNLNRRDLNTRFPGFFTDMALNAERAIERGSPSRSVLFHLLSSHGVRPQGATEEDYLSLEELIVLENFVFVAHRTGVRPASLKEIKTSIGQETKLDPDEIELGIAVFSLDYRRGNETTHRQHADMCFSRTGISRVGTHSPYFDRAARGYWPVFNNDKRGADEKAEKSAETAIRVVPARYAPFIAVKLKANLDTFGPLPTTPGRLNGSERQGEYWVPVHKLFSGPDCLAGVEIPKELLVTHHVNEKILRIHMTLLDRDIDFKPMIHSATQRPKPVRRLNTKPFFITQGIATLDEVTGNVLPEAKPLAAKTRISFSIPSNIRAGLKRYNPYGYTYGNVFFGLFDSSLVMRVRDETGRAIPEYLHIRDEVQLGDLNQQSGMMDNDGYNDILLGDRRFYHYVDYTGDGWVTLSQSAQALLQQRFPELPVYPAYSIVAAPDFYPMVNQHALMEWSRSISSWGQATPDELSSVRLNPNLELKIDGDNQDYSSPVVSPDMGGKPNAVSVFRGVGAELRTITAIVGLPHLRTARRDFRYEFDQLPNAPRATTLSDGAAGVFAPGWAVSQHDTSLANYGLGSPFPEDAKLCAALSGYWPGVAPDTTRTFVRGGLAGGKIVAPMTDREIGISGDDSDLAWDGVQGPIEVNLPARNSPYLRYPDASFADYVFNSVQGKFSLQLTSLVTTTEYINRMRIVMKLRSSRFWQSNYELFKFEKSDQEENTYDLVVAPISSGRKLPGQDHRFFFSELTQAPRTLRAHIRGSDSVELTEAARRIESDFSFNSPTIPRP